MWYESAHYSAMINANDCFSLLIYDELVVARETMPLWYHLYSTYREMVLSDVEGHFYWSKRDIAFILHDTIWNNAVTLIYIIDVSISSPQCHGFEIYLYVWTFHRQQSLDIAKDAERPILAHISQLIQIIQWLRVNLDLIVE